MFLSRLSDGAAIFLTIIILLATVGLIILLFMSIKKEHKKYLDEQASYIEGVISKTEMIANINSYIAKSNFLEFTLLLIDLDSFTNTVNAFGQQEANMIVEKIAYAVLAILPKRVDIARFEEDKFIVFIRGEYDRKDAIQLTEKILEVIQNPIKVYGESIISVTASIGVSFFPIHGRTFKALYSSLEMAVYICKRNGGNQINIYSADVGAKESENLEYYHQIKNAIKNHEFDLYYHPMIDCKSNQIYGFEGLLRWNHPELGVLSPYKFINIMEQSGDINWVGLWGLETLITKYEELRRKYPDLELKLSMNLSPKQLTNPTVANDFQKLIKKQHIPPKTIILEIEEFALFEKHEAVKKNIQLLSDLGFGIAVDGFGLDYAALTKLDAMPIDMVKLDNDFLNEETDSFMKEKFAGLLVSYSQDQNKIIICEGIENGKMLHKAFDRGIYLVQGYYFSKPIPQTELDDFIYQKNWNEKIKETTEDQVKEVALENIVPISVEEELQQINPDEEVVKEETLEEEVKEEVFEEVIEEVIEEENTEVIKKTSSKAKSSKATSSKSKKDATKKATVKTKKEVQEVKEDLVPVTDSEEELTIGEQQEEFDKASIDEKK